MGKLLLSCGRLRLFREAHSGWRIWGFKVWVERGHGGRGMAGWGIISQFLVVLLWCLGLMLQVILQGNKNWLPISKHNSMLSCLLLEAGHSGVTVTRLHRVRRPAEIDARALSMDLSGSLVTLGEVQGSEGDLFPHATSTLVRGNQTTNHLLHLEV